MIRMNEQGGVIPLLSLSSLSSSTLTTTAQQNTHESFFYSNAMGNTNGKNKKSKQVLQVNKSNSYPITKRGRRSTIDGLAPHLDLEVAKQQNKRATATLPSEAKYRLPQQLAELKLGETIRKGRVIMDDDFDFGGKPLKKKGGSKMNIFNSVRQHRTYP